MRPTVIKCKKRRARKQHKCIECQRTINPGELYEHISGVWDSRGDSFKQCLVCAEIFNHVMGYFDEIDIEDGALCFGSLADCLYDFDFDSEQELADDMGVELWKVRHILSSLPFYEHA